MILANIQNLRVMPASMSDTSGTSSSASWPLASQRTMEDQNGIGGGHKYLHLNYCDQSHGHRWRQVICDYMFLRTVR